MAKRQVRSRERVRELGEVFTGSNEVRAMTALWAAQAGPGVADAAVLEPSCGTCNVLAEVLQVKVEDLRQQRWHRPRHEVAMRYVVAAASLYGIDIDERNIRESKEIMVRVWCENTSDLPADLRARVQAAGTRAIQRNLLCADFLNPDADAQLAVLRRLPAKRHGRWVVEEYMVSLRSACSAPLSEPVEAIGSRPREVPWWRVGL